MPPLRLAAIGLVLVTVTLNLGSFVLSLDLMGWILVALGMNQLMGSAGGWFTWTRNLALAVVGLHLIQWLLPVAGAGLLILSATLSRIAVMALIFCLCTGLLAGLGKRDTVHSVVLQALRVLLPLASLAAAVFTVVDAPAGLPLGWLYPMQWVGSLVLAVVMWLLGSRYAYSR